MLRKAKKNPSIVENFSSNTRMVRAAIVEGSALCRICMGCKVGTMERGPCIREQGNFIDLCLHGCPFLQVSH